MLSQAPNRFSSCDKCLREVVRCCGMWSRHHGHSPIRIEFKAAAGSGAGVGVFTGCSPRRRTSTRWWGCGGGGVRGAVAEGCGGGGRVGRPWGHATTGTGGLDLSRHHGHSPIRIEFKGAAGSGAGVGTFTGGSPRRRTSTRWWRLKKPASAELPLFFCISKKRLRKAPCLFAQTKGSYGGLHFRSRALTKLSA